MRCPRCGDEYRDSVEVCAECRVPLRDPAEGPAPDALLGTFDPSVAELVADLLDERGIVHALEPIDAAVRVRVDPAWREDVRAELVVRWPELLGDLPTEEMRAVLGGGRDGGDGGGLAGWHDAPRGAWVDRTGRLRVGGRPREEADADARRVLGPSMVLLGAVLALFGWYTGSGELPVVTGVVLVIGGLLSPR